MEELLKDYGALIVLDTETTGLDPDDARIIELAAVRLEMDGEELKETGSMDRFIRLPVLQTLPERIVELTHITDAMLEAEGVDQDEAADEFIRLIVCVNSKPLLAAYNAQFDLCFLRRLLAGKGKLDADFLDVLTVYKDRRAYPHKLTNAIDAYSLGEKVQNSHRAIDDVRATVEVMKAMAAERDDLVRYVNLFGYNPKYGAPKEKIRGVRYHAQSFSRGMVAEEWTLPALADYKAVEVPRNGY